MTPLDYCMCWLHQKFVMSLYMKYYKILLFYVAVDRRTVPFGFFMHVVCFAMIYLFVLCMLSLCMLLPIFFHGEVCWYKFFTYVIFAELTRRERQKKMRRQNWVWGTIGSAAIVLGTTLLWSYLPNNEGSSLKNDFNAS